MVKLPDIDDRPLTFGKYKGETPNEIAKRDPHYITWIYKNVEEKHLSTELYDECCEIIDQESEILHGGPLWY